MRRICRKANLHNTIEVGLNFWEAVQTFEVQTFVSWEVTASYLAQTQLTVLECWLWHLSGLNSLEGGTEVRRQGCHLASKIMHQHLRQPYLHCLERIEGKREQLSHSVSISTRKEGQV